MVTISAHVLKRFALWHTKDSNQGQQDCWTMVCAVSQVSISLAARKKIPEHCQVHAKTVLQASRSGVIDQKTAAAHKTALTR